MKNDRPKDRGNENFPVASILLPKRLRRPVIRFYRFARSADDIADNPDLNEAEKLAHLDHMEHALLDGAVDAMATTTPPAPTQGPNAAAREMGESFAETGVDMVHARELLEAFRRDVLKPRTADWQDLMSYCRLSAAPVGRYLITLSGGVRDGDTGTMKASDGLCAALQVLNHLQGIKEDYQKLGRIYLPQDWLQGEGVSESDLALDKCTPGLRRVVDRMLDRTQRLLQEARPLSKGIRSRGMAREAAGILMLARRLHEMLGRCDPLAGRVALSRPVAAMWFMLGWIRG